MKIETITLDKPLVRGEEKITKIDLRCPDGAGELRGVKLMQVHLGDVDSILTLTQRLTMTPLSQAEIDDIGPRDLAKITAAILGFF